MTFTFISCAKISYLWEQGTGQISILTSGEKNSIILSDASIPLEHKRKIREIGKYKDFFYTYFSEKKSEIYTETTILDREAVSYLVTASPHYEIKAKKECFPFVGCFPYLGFFSQKSALEHEEKLKGEGYVTWVRPVYAYSTLGYFTDTIISSFFAYDDFLLAEMIFHELFHTLFFIKSEVKFNENLANYFGREMAYLYFAKLGKYSERKRQLELQDILKDRVVELIKELNSDYKSKPGLTREMSKSVFERFMESRFLPEMKSICKSYGIKEKQCALLKRKWNNASFVGFLTYQNKRKRLHQMRSSVGQNLVDFYKYLVKEHKKYEDSDTDKKFGEVFLN